VSAPAPSLPAFRRVVVAIDAGAPAREILDAAVGLAARLGAELEALMVEQADQLRAARLPVALLALPGGWALDPATLASGLRTAAERVRRFVEEAATREQLRWSFRVVGERAAAEAVQGGAGEIVVVERTWPPPSGARAEPGAAGWPGAPRAVLVVRSAARRRPPSPRLRLSVLWDGSAAAGEALDLALAIAGGARGEPRLLVAAADLREAERLAGEAVPRAGRWLPWGWAGGAGPAELARALPLDAVLVVASGSPAAGGVSGRERLLAAASGAVLLVG
jgi:hypothetical protein